MPVKPSETMSYLADGTAGKDYEGAYEGTRRSAMTTTNRCRVSARVRGRYVRAFFGRNLGEHRGIGRAGVQADEVLFHELVHITRMIRGRETHTQVDGGGYGNIEEYFATVITNVYMSDKGLIAARRRHAATDHQTEPTCMAKIGTRFSRQHRSRANGLESFGIEDPAGSRQPRSLNCPP